MLQELIYQSPGNIALWETQPKFWYTNIGSGNGLVLGGTKPLPEPMLIIQTHKISFVAR